MFRVYKSGESVVKFWANAKAGRYELSNFAIIKEGIKPFDDGNVFLSAEHAYQASKFVERYRFAMNGDLGNEDGFKVVFGKNAYKTKKKYWLKKGNIGIIAKMAAKHFAKYGLTPIKDFVSTPELWMKILKKKFSISRFNKILMGTGDSYLLEFGRGCKKEYDKGHIPYWNGIIVDNKLYGINMMGMYLMEVRKIW